MTPITGDASRNRPVPICACCKQIRNDTAHWERLELYLLSHFGIEFTHTLCPVHLAAEMERLLENAQTHPMRRVTDTIPTSSDQDQ
jgi:hypothetical protein